MSGTRVRAYAPTDRAGCLAVFDSNVPRFFRPPEREQFGRFLDELPGPYLVLEETGEVVGCGGCAPGEEPGVADLCWGMVHARRHGTGVGRLLTEARIEQARRELGAREVVLNTSQHTRGFYERLGFVTTRVVADGYAPGLDRCDMRLRLEDS